MAFDLIAELEQLVDALEREHVEYAVCGGVALAIHGHPRATKDIDLLVRPETAPRAREIARALGFDVPARKMTFGLAAGTPRTIERISKLDEKDGAMLPLDLIHAEAELVAVWTSRIRVPWREREMSVVSRDGLVTMKQIAGRPQDLVDLSRLEGIEDPEA
jgi:hypothetical protein